MSTNKKIAPALLAGVLIALSPAFVMAEDAAPMTPDAFVWLTRDGLGLILGGSSGGGRIHFKGDDEPFRMSGISFGALGGIGETRMSGEVYGMTKMEDFAGTYKESAAGISVIAGGGGIWLENEKGVKMHLTAESKGVGINLSVGTVKIKLGMVD